jgi:hypothetical protein
MAGTEDDVRQEVNPVVDELRQRLHDCVTAMELWGSWEDGVPEGGPGEHGIVGNAYDMAKATLGLCDATGERIGQAMRHMREERGRLLRQPAAVLEAAEKLLRDQSAERVYLEATNVRVVTMARRVGHGATLAAACAALDTSPRADG